MKGTVTFPISYTTSPNVTVDGHIANGYFVLTTTNPATFSHSYGYQATPAFSFGCWISVGY